MNTPEKDYSHRGWIAALALIAVLGAVSFIPPQSLGGVKLRRANILSDILSFEDAAAEAAEPALFDEDDFQKLYDKSSCTGTFKYLVFDRPSTSEYANGTIYSRYGKRNETSFSRSALNGNTFGYSDYADGDYDLSDLSFVADKAFTSGSITLSFTLYGGTGSRTNQSTTGTLKITSGKSSSTTSRPRMG